ncbi:MAG: metalloregulator ArsR/SmtB family transcription factor [Nitrosopumilus sp.]
MMTDELTQTEQVARIFSVLSTNRRCKILRLLIDSEQPVNSSMIANIIGESDATTSFNLTALREAGVIGKVPSGRWAFYFVNPDAITAIANFLTVQEPEDEYRPTS